MIFYLALLLGTLAADQWLKLWVLENLELYAARPLLPGIVELKYIQNTGGGWSILSQHTWLLSLFSAAVVLVLSYFLLAKIVRHPVGKLGCLLLISGGIGNLIDRVRLGFVVDMFNLQFMNYPVFNIADICIVCGMFMAAYYYMFLYDKYDAKQKGAPDGDHPAA